jgi:hypothetical protein
MSPETTTRHPSVGFQAPHIVALLKFISKSCQRTDWLALAMNSRIIGVLAPRHAGGRGRAKSWPTSIHVIFAAPQWQVCR